MKLATEVGVFMGLIRTAVVLLGFGAVVLFDRMSPAIHRILADNVVTLVDVEQMLAVIGQPELPQAEAHKRFGDALHRALQNLTESDERPLLERIQVVWQDALREDSTPAARQQLLTLLLDLSEVNRVSMEVADEEAARLGAAGAWSVVLLSLAILALSQFFGRRLDVRVVQPLRGLQEVVQAAEGGDRHRRCPTGGPKEFGAIAAGLNRLLDEVQKRRTAAEDFERELLECVLQARAGAWVAVDRTGTIRAANTEAQRHLEGQGWLSGTRRPIEEESLGSSGLRLLCVAAADAQGKASH